MRSTVSAVHLQVFGSDRSKPKSTWGAKETILSMSVHEFVLLGCVCVRLCAKGMNALQASVQEGAKCFQTLFAPNLRGERKEESLRTEKSSL